MNNLFDEEDIENDIIEDIDEKDEQSKKANDIDDEKEETDQPSKKSSDEDEYKINPSTSLLKYLRTEVKFKEFSRKKISFSLYSDGDEEIVYNGYPLKELKGGNAFIFEILKPEKKMKKVNLNDISMYF